MKTINLILAFLFPVMVMAQNTPQFINYQAVVAGNTGQVLANRNVALQFGILPSVAGSPVYQESHSVTTNNYGLVNLQLGKGTSSLGQFAQIDWSSGNYYLNVALDSNGGSNFRNLGTTQLASVPYAQYAARATNHSVAGSGIGISGDTIKNVNPDKVVVLNPDSGVQISGSYPDFKLAVDSNFVKKLAKTSKRSIAGNGIGISGDTIKNANPDKVVVLNQGSGLNISGTYPAFNLAVDSNYVKRLANANSGNTGPCVKVSACGLSMTGFQDSVKVGDTLNLSLNFGGGISGSEPFSFQWKSNPAGLITFTQPDSMSTKAVFNYVGTVEVSNTFSNNCSGRYAITNRANVKCNCKPDVGGTQALPSLTLQSGATITANAGGGIEPPPDNLNYGQTYTYNISVPANLNLIGGHWYIWYDECPPPSNSYTIVSQTSTSVTFQINSGYTCTNPANPFITDPGGFILVYRGGLASTLAPQVYCVPKYLDVFLPLKVN